MKKVPFHNLPVGTPFSLENVPFASYLKIESYIYKGAGINTSGLDVNYEEVNAVVYSGTHKHPTGTLEFIPPYRNVLIPR